MSAWLSSDPGRLWVWGAYTRSLGLVFTVSLAGLAWNALPLAGRRGLTPARDAFAARWRDFGARALWWWPSLFWLTGTSDAAVVGLPLVGAAAGLAAAAGWHSQVSLALAWAALLSVDAGSQPAIYPWDTLLLEAGFLGLFLPALPLLVQGGGVHVAGAALPPPVLAWALRWLLARVLLGFGKLKFQSAQWRDRAYIKPFLISQPIPTLTGYAVYQLLPDFAFPALLAGMWVVEIPLPLVALATTGATRALVALAVVGLMGGIQLTGNYGYFNVVTAVSALPLLDHASALTLSGGWAGNLLPPGSALPGALAAARAQAPSGGAGGGLAAAVAAAAAALAAHWRELVLPVLLSAWIPLSGLQFIMNSWINLAWPHYSGIYRLRLPRALRPSQWAAAALRAVMQWRAVGAYGVFPPNTGVPGRALVVMEGSRDGGVTWTRYRYWALPSAAASAPCAVAPYHPRLDHITFYHYGASENVPGCSFAVADPYAFFASGNTWVRLQAALLRGGRARGLARLLGGDAATAELLARPPAQVRGVALALLPAPSLAAALATGRFWVETRLGVLHPPLSLAACAAQSAHPTVPPNSAQQQQAAAAAAAAAAAEGRGEAAGAGGDPTVEEDDAPPGWPLSDASGSGAEDFWPEFVFWRRRARQTSGVITPADYEAAWAFVDALRGAAAGAAASAARAALAAGGATPPGFVSAALAAASSGAPVASPEDAALPPVPLDVLERTRLRLEPEWRAVAAAAEGVMEALAGGGGGGGGGGAGAGGSGGAGGSRRRRGASASPRRRGGGASSLPSPAAAAASPGAAALPLAAAHEVLVWSFLPQAYAALRARYTAGELVALRRTLCRMSLPLLLACERLFDRRPAALARARAPADAQRAAAAFAAVAAGARLPEAEFEEALEVALGGHALAADTSLPAAASGVAAATPEGFPVHLFAGNAGGEAGFAPGRMGEPLGWFAHAQYALLVGGRGGYERAAALVLAPPGAGGGPPRPADFLLGRRLPTCLSHADAAPLRAAHPQEVLRALCVVGGGGCGSASAPLAVPPGGAPTEAALLLSMALSYQSWAASAIGFQRGAGQSRLSRERGGLPHFFPGAVALVPRIMAHPGLRRLYDDCGLSAERDAQGFLPPPRTLRWQPSADETQWLPRGLHVEGAALAAAAVAAGLAAPATQEATAPPPPPPHTHLLVLYDGVCRLCNWVVAFLVARDPDASRFQFAAIQSAAGAAALAAAGIPAAEALDSFTVVDRATGQAYRKSTAALVVAAALPGRAYGAVALAGTLLLPAWLRDAAYDLVARTRYAVWGKLGSGGGEGDDSLGCLAATPAVLRRFLDAEEVMAGLRAQSAARRAAKAALRGAGGGRDLDGKPDGKRA